MSDPLLHLITPADWRAALATGSVAPPSLAEVGFVHLSNAAQVPLPAGRLFHGRTDLLLLVLDPDRLGVDVRWEPGLPTDPASMRFPHAYGPVPTGAVLGVLPFRPRPDGGFDAPTVPVLDAAGRTALLQPSLLRRVATSEEPVTGGVAVRTAPVPASRQHNRLLVDGPTDAATVEADAARALPGLTPTASLTDAGLAAQLAARGWTVDALVEMAAPVGGVVPARVEQVDLDALRPFWRDTWRHELPGVTDDEIRQLADRYALEEAAVDVRYLAVRDGGEVVASCVLKVDGATAYLDAVQTTPAHQGSGHGNALLTGASATAAAAGCDLLGLGAATQEWPRHWYARHGFVEVGRSWSASLLPDDGKST